MAGVLLRAFMEKIGTVLALVGTSPSDGTATTGVGATALPAPRGTPSPILNNRHREAAASTSAAAAKDGRTIDTEKAGGNQKEEGPKPFHLRVADSASSVASSQIAVSFALIVKPPSGVHPGVLDVYYFFAMLCLGTGSWILFLHIARDPSTEVACLQVTAVAVGFASAVVDGFLYVFVSIPHSEFSVVFLLLVLSAVVLYLSAATIRGMVVARKMHVVSHP